MKKRLLTQGMYKHNRVDILDLMHRDLQAISDAIGTNNYVLGNEHPTLVRVYFIQTSFILNKI